MSYTILCAFIYCLLLQTGRKWLEETNIMASSQQRQCSLRLGVTLTSSGTIRRQSALRRMQRAMSSAPEAGRGSGAVPPESERMTLSTWWGMLRRGTLWLAFHFGISALWVNTTVFPPCVTWVDNYIQTVHTDAISIRFIHHYTGISFIPLLFTLICTKVPCYNVWFTSDVGWNEQITLII